MEARPHQSSFAVAGRLSDTHEDLVDKLAVVFDLVRELGNGVGRIC